MTAADPQQLEDLVLELELCARNFLRHRRSAAAAGELRRACKRSKAYRDLAKAQSEVARQERDAQPEPPSGHPAGDPAIPTTDTAGQAAAESPAPAPRLPYKDN